MEIIFDKNLFSVIGIHDDEIKNFFNIKFYNNLCYDSQNIHKFPYEKKMKLNYYENNIDLEIYKNPISTIK